jgi:flagellar protein FliO/FliZ
VFSGIGLPPWALWALLFLAILVGILVVWRLIRPLIGSRISLPGHGRARQPRLGIVDIYDLDRQRQLVLLRRDNVEHLLLIGGPNDVVVESNIARLPPRQATHHPDVPERAPGPSRPPLEPPRPVVDTIPASERGPAPAEARTGNGGSEAPGGEPGSRPAKAADASTSDAEEELAPIGTMEPVSVTARAEPVLRAEPVPAPVRGVEPAFPPMPPQAGKPAPASPSAAPAPSAPAPARPGAPPVPPARPVHSNPIPFPTGAAPQPPRPVEKGGAEAPPKETAPAGSMGPAKTPSQAEPGAVRPHEPRPAAPQAAASPPGPRAPDTAILSDMTRQLEQALRRPSPPVNPDRPGEPAAVSAVAPTRPGSGSTQSGPAAAAPSPEKKPAEGAAAKPPGKEDDPFSVEEIEAEFARLLGRTDKS